jgi:hypothetical protein
LKKCVPIQWKARSVRANQRAGFAVFVDAAEQLALDVKIFDNGFDDPIGGADALQVVGEVAGLKTPRDIGGEIGRGTGLFKRFDGVSSDRAARGAVRALGRQVKQQAVHAGIGQVRRDARAHSARAQNRRCGDLASHSIFLRTRK